jgi:hypothetical protein
MGDFFVGLEEPDFQVLVQIICAFDIDALEDLSVRGELS